MNSSSKIYREAVKYVGLKEVKGPRSNPLIQSMIKEAASWLNPDDSLTPWCGCFRGHVGLVTATGVPREHFRAREWLKWGNVVRINEVIQGDTVILLRKGGGHVGIFDRFEAGEVWVLGGNQADEVSIAPFPISAMIGIRRLEKP